MFVRRQYLHARFGATLDSIKAVDHASQVHRVSHQCRTVSPNVDMLRHTFQQATVPTKRVKICDTLMHFSHTWKLIRAPS